MLEDWLKAVRGKAMAVLTESLGGKNVSQDLVSELGIGAVRMAMGKKITHLGWPLPKGFATGKPTTEKLGALFAAWAKYVQAKYPSVPLLEPLGVKRLDEESPAEVIFDCAEEGAPSDPSSRPSGPSTPGPSAPKFKVGDRVCLLKRQSWNCPIAGNASHRKDISSIENPNGPTELRVVSAVGDTSYLCETDLVVGGEKRTLGSVVLTTNLQLFSLWVEGKASTSGKGEEGEEAKEKNLVPDGYEWLNNFEDRLEEDAYVPSKCDVVPWPSLGVRSKHDVQQDLSAEAVYLMNVLDNIAPQLTEEDLVLAHRQSTKKDAPHTVEVWTARDFKAHELILVPYAHEVKDRHWTRSRSAWLRTTAKGKALLGNKALAIDGRFRGDFQAPPSGPSSAAETAAQTRLGSMFFCVQRTPSKSCTNLVQSYSAVTLTAQVMLPGTSKTLKKEVPRSVDIPILSNPKPLKAHTRLQVLEDIELLKFESQWKTDSGKRVAEAAAATAAKRAKAA